MDSTLCHVTHPHDQVYAIITRSRFGHKLPINSQKVGDKSVQKKTRDVNNNRLIPTVKCETNHVKNNIVKFTDKAPTQTSFLRFRTIFISLCSAADSRTEQVSFNLSFNFHLQFTNKSVVSL